MQITARHTIVLIVVALLAFFGATSVVHAYAYGYGEGYYYGYAQGYYYGYAQGYYYGYAQGYYYGYAQGTYQTLFTQNATEAINLTASGNVSKGSGSFVIDHPLDPANKLLYHSFVESPDVKNFYDGIVTLNKNGEAVVALPNYFDALNTDVRYQLKPIGAPMPNLHIQTEEKDNQFTIGGGIPGGKVSWQITGIRHDPYILANPIVPEVEKGPDQIADKGEYLFPEGYTPSLFERITDYFKGLLSR